MFCFAWLWPCASLRKLDGGELRIGASCSMLFSVCVCRSSATKNEVGESHFIS